MKKQNVERKGMKILLVMVIFLGLEASSSYAQGGVVNLLPNGDLERGGWGFSGPIENAQVVSALVDAAVPNRPVEGDYCYYIQNTRTDGEPEVYKLQIKPVTIGQHVTLKKGKKYTASAFLKSKSGKLQTRVVLEYRDEATLLWPLLAGGDDLDITEEWTELHLTTGVLPKDLDVQFGFHFGTRIGAFWIDDVKIYEGQYVPSTTARSKQAETPKAASGVVNLLPNGGSERGGWGFSGPIENAQVVSALVDAAVPDRPVEGDYCYYIQNTRTDDEPEVYKLQIKPVTPGQHVTLKKGKIYTASAFLKSKSGKLQTRVVLEYRDETTLLWPLLAGGDDLDITEEWTELHLTTGALPKDLDVQFGFHFGTRIGAFWIDDVKIYEGQYVPSTTARSKQAETPKAASGEKQVTNSIGMKLTLIPAGEFKMGSGESSEALIALLNKTYPDNPLPANFYKNEHPQHPVRITKPFYLGTYHVTLGQFRQFVADTKYVTYAEKDTNPGANNWDPDTKEVGQLQFVLNKKGSWRNTGFEQTDEHPVVNINWNDAVAFCKWLSKKEGKTYRLPTEAEWEYACRAGTTTRYYNGDDCEALVTVANLADTVLKVKFPNQKGTLKGSDGYVFTSPVGSFKPNAFGLYDMHGNAWQWCADFYGSQYYAASPTDDPTGPESGDRGGNRVIRGGSWEFRGMSTRCAKRRGFGPDAPFSFIGFRVAMSE